MLMMDRGPLNIPQPMEARPPERVDENPGGLNLKTGPDECRDVERERFDDHAAPKTSPPPDMGEYEFTAKEVAAEMLMNHAHERKLFTTRSIVAYPDSIVSPLTQLGSYIFGAKADQVKPYKCPDCSKPFANTSYLTQHKRIHLGIKPYQCEICRRKFTQLSHLQQHVRTHTGDKPYRCRFPGCIKAFAQLSHLQIHSRSHETDKPFKCTDCYKCFAEKNELLQHMPRHLKTHVCRECGKSYTQETYLLKHMQKHAENTAECLSAAAEREQRNSVMNSEAVQNSAPIPRPNEEEARHCFSLWQKVFEASPGRMLHEKLAKPPLPPPGLQSTLMAHKSIMTDAHLSGSSNLVCAPHMPQNLP